MTTAVVPRRRPALIVVVIVLVYLSGLSNTALGILVLLSRYQVDAGEVLPVSLLGAAIILLGLLTLAGASAISRASRLARGLITAYLAIQIALHIVTMVTTEWDPVAALQIVLELFVIVVMWTPPGSRWFRQVH